MTAGYGTGLDALLQSINSAKSKGKGNGSKLGYITWKDGETKVLRFLTNEVLSVDVAEWVATNDGKTQDFMVDATKGNFVAKYNGKTKNRQTQEWEDPKLKKKGIAVAVIRKQVPLGGGRTEIVEHTEMVTHDGVAYNARVFGVLKQALPNFWKPLMAIAANYGGLITDRDWAITRSGGDKDTIYIPQPIEPTGDAGEALRDPEVVAQYYGYGRPWNEQDPERFLFCPETLPQWAEYYSGEERAKFWLTPKVAAAAPGAFNPQAPGSGSVAGLQQPYTTITAAPPIPQPSISGLGYTVPPQPQNPAPPAFTAPPAPAMPPSPAMSAPVPAPAPPVPAGPPFVPTPPGQPAFVPAQPQAQPQAPGPWGSNEDEAQAVPSSATKWADLQSTLMPHLTEAAVAQQTDPVSS